MQRIVGVTTVGVDGRSTSGAALDLSTGHQATAGLPKPPNPVMVDARKFSANWLPLQFR